MQHEQFEDSTLRTANSLPTRLAFITIVLVAIFSVTGCATAAKQTARGKFYHVGLIWLKEPGNVGHRQKIIAAAHSFAREIPDVQSLSVGQSPASTSPYVDDSFDICFVMRLEDRAALDRYGKHPVHEKAANEVFLPLSQRVLFYDFTSE